jgi:hypothetical protein
MAGPFTDQALWARVIRHARCADGTHDPEQWFPVSVRIEKARHEAAAAIAVCAICPVRAHCLALSLRHCRRVVATAIRRRAVPAVA